LTILKNKRNNLHKTLVIVLTFISIWSCQNSPEQRLKFVNGYWEIEKVTFPNDQEKVYNYNSLVDYIEIENNKGYRKKLKPNIENTYLTSDDKEFIEVKIENDSLNFYYKTPFNAWKETVITADENILVIVLANDVRYQYKRFESLNLNDE